jgi:hypothetical protein
MVGHDAQVENVGVLDHGIEESMEDTDCLKFLVVEIDSVDSIVLAGFDELPENGTAISSDQSLILRRPTRTLAIGMQPT